MVEEPAMAAQKGSKMKRKMLILGIILLAVLMLAGGCAAERSPYEQNDEEGYTVSVRYDANGGYFTTNTSVIVDAYELNALPESGGKKTVALLSPEDASRGTDAFKPINNGYFLAGWYAERTESVDANGNVTYIYGKKWDFAKDRLEVDANGSYSSAQPVLTLYAVWAPLFQLEFYEQGTGTYISTLSFDPTAGQTFQIPAWDPETGTMEMYDFPEKEGCTFQNVSLDVEGTQPVTDTSFSHTGVLNADNGTADKSVMKLYVQYLDEEWYHIYTAEQFVKYAGLSVHYEICADLDFTDVIWPSTLMYGHFSGSVIGNGHTLSNITLEQTNNSKTNAGLFGLLTETAKITDLKLEHVTFTVKAGTRVAGTSYGLLAGSVSSGAQISGVQIADGILAIHSDCYFGTEEYDIGLVCGVGQTDVDYSGITAQAVGDAPDTVHITVDGQQVRVQIEIP